MTIRRKYLFTSRPAAPNDAEDIVRIQRMAVERSWRPFVKNFDAFLKERFDHDSQVKKYAERALDSNRVILVVETDGDVIGFAAANTIGKQDGYSLYDYLWGSLYIDPPYEGIGAGRSLASAFLDALKQRQAKGIMAWCLAENHRARNFYEKMGAKLIPGAVTPEEYAAVAPHVAYGLKLADTE